MTTDEFVTAVERLIWSEVGAPPTLEETFSVLETLEDEHSSLLSSLKDLSKSLLASDGWIEQARLAQSLLWSLRVLQIQGQLRFSLSPEERKR